MHLPRRPEASRWITAVTGTLVLALSTVVAADAPSGHEIIANFVERSGGHEAYAKIKNRVIEATLDMPDHGAEGEMTEFFAPPDYRRVITVDIYDDNIDAVSHGVAWTRHPIDGPEILEGERAVATKRQAQLNLFLEWTPESGEAKVVGEGKVGEEDCFRVEIVPNQGATLMAYFGKESGLLRRLDNRQAILFLYFDDYRELDGVLVPYATRFEAGMMMADVTVVSVTQNTDLDDTMFDLPPELEDLSE